MSVVRITWANFYFLSPPPYFRKGERLFKFYTELKREEDNKIYTQDGPEVSVVKITWANFYFFTPSPLTSGKVNDHSNFTQSLKGRRTTKFIHRMFPTWLWLLGWATWYGCIGQTSCSFEHYLVFHRWLCLHNEQLSKQQQMTYFHYVTSETRGTRQHNFDVPSTRLMALLNGSTAQDHVSWNNEVKMKSSYEQVSKLSGTWSMKDDLTDSDIYRR